MKKLMKNKKGFTIVELVIVIAVIGILAAVLVPTFGNIIEKANQSKALQNVKNAYTATLANDLSDDDSSNDVVYGKGEIKVIVNDKYVVSIDANGQATVANKNSETATHTMNNGLLVVVSSNDSNNDNADAQG